MHYFERNYIRTKPLSRVVDSRYKAASDNLYDGSKGVNFLYINYGTKDNPLYRLASDAELAFSQSPDITSIVPPAVQANLRLAIQSQPRTGKSVSVDSPVNVPYEMDEVAFVASQMLDKHNQQCIDDYNRIVDEKLSSSSAVTPPSETTTVKSDQPE